MMARKIAARGRPCGGWRALGRGPVAPCSPADPARFTPLPNGLDADACRRLPVSPVDPGAQCLLAVLASPRPAA
jgi:hypothetical protein